MTAPQPAVSASPPPDRLRIAIYSSALLIAVAGLAYYGYVRFVDQPLPVNDVELQELRRIFAATAQDQKLADAYRDADGDLVADVPSDPSQLQNVNEIGFCMATLDDPERAQAEWQDFLMALEQATGKKVVYRAELTDLSTQLAALRDGRLQIAAFGTGTVPTAVNSAGFVPLAAPADADGTYGYEMEILVPAKSSSKSPADLKGKTIAFTSLSSNSGAKAPLVILKNEFQLLPVRDYRYVLTGSHQRSIKEFAEGTHDAACMANDLLARAVAAGDIKPEQYRSIYKSGSFPPLCLGVAHNLPAELSAQVKKVVEDFQFAGTSLERPYAGQGKVRFALVDYKRDWAQVREIDEALPRLLDAM